MPAKRLEIVTSTERNRVVYRARSRSRDLPPSTLFSQKLFGGGCSTSMTPCLCTVDNPRASRFRRNALARRKHCSQYNIGCTVRGDSFVPASHLVNLQLPSKHRSRVAFLSPRNIPEICHQMAGTVSQGSKCFWFSGCCENA